MEVKSGFNLPLSGEKMQIKRPPKNIKPSNFSYLDSNYEIVPSIDQNTIEEKDDSPIQDIIEKTLERRDSINSVHSQIAEKIREFHQHNQKTKRVLVEASNYSEENQEEQELEDGDQNFTDENQEEGEVEVEDDENSDAGSSFYQ